MLVLTRRNEESVWIGDAEVKVMEAREGRVRLGITAPPEIAVDRDEIRKLKQETGDARGTTIGRDTGADSIGRG